VNILNRIFETKREEIATAKATVSISALEDQAKGQPLLPFRDTLKTSAHPVALIAEVKKASPSKGLIRADFDPLEIARTYQAAGADCLSVLTDAPYFQGSPENLRTIKKNLEIPCLRKDFICDLYQVFEARAWGADAVLLIAASLEKSLISDLRFQIEALGMDAFLEVHDEKECETAIELGFRFVGVNNRNLRDFKVDLEASEQLIPLLQRGLPDALIVSESALSTKFDIDRVQAAGARAVLIGTTFCASPDIGGKVHEVMGW
jgi:indole-3-glycerol phosphate synthase